MVYVWDLIVKQKGQSTVSCRAGLVPARVGIAFTRKKICFFGGCILQYTLS